MLIGKQYIFRKFFQHVKAIEVSGSRMKKVPVKQAIIINAGRGK